MGDSQVLIAVIAILSTVIGVVVTCISLMVWLVKRSDTRQDSTINRNSTALEKNNVAYTALSQSISQSASASRSLEESIRKRDEQDREFQEHVLKGFKTQSNILKQISEKSDLILNALPHHEENK